jgi:prepilin-type N-terminal cleavage/methylation domain-containing protein
MNLSFNQKRHDRFGFTMVELLLVISIIAVMSSMALVVMKNAQEEAKEAATIARVDQIESLLQLQIEDYEVRRLPIRVSELAAFVNANPIAGIKRLVQVRNLKRRIMADIINAELPRPFLDASNFFINNPDLGKFPTEQAPLNAIPPYDDGFYDWLQINYPNPAFPGGPTLADRLRFVRPAGVDSWIRQNGNLNFDLPGEYLYAILQRIDVDGTAATEQLGDSFFGDSDEDGILEVVDAWGLPMSLQIWQVAAEEVDSTGAPDVGSDIWQDDVTPPQNYEIFATYTLNGENVRLRNPDGYVLMNPVIPREIAKLRFEVTSFGLSNRIH